MRLKQYQGHSTHDVMTRIRHELGSDALIVSTEKENGLVKIVAAQDYTSRISRKNEKDYTLENILRFHKAPGQIIDKIKQSLKKSSGHLKDDLKQVLNRIANSSSLERLYKRKKPLMLIGTPGVGKTLATAKISAQAVLNDQTVQVISTDRQKTGALEQIEQLTKNIHVPFKSIENPKILHKSLQELTSDIVLIDTAGINPYNDEDRKRLHELVEAASAEVILVMTARGDDDYCCEIEDAFEDFNTKYLLLTQADLCPHKGHILTRAIESQYSLLAVGKNQEVANFLIPSISDEFINLFISENLTRSRK